MLQAERFEWVDISGDSDGAWKGLNKMKSAKKNLNGKL